MKYLEYLILEAANPKDIYKKYYDDIDFDHFLQIVLADPTSKPLTDARRDIKKMGRYSKWMLKLYKNNKLLLEDLYKFTRTLSLFHTLNIRGILKRDMLPADINWYRNLPELWDAIKEYQSDDEEGVIDVGSHEYELFWENEKCKVIIPKTHRASCFFGKKSDWCTASDSSSYYDQYSQQGPIFIIMDKEDPENKYQFHIPSSQFADINDNMLMPDDINSILTNMDLDVDFVEAVFERNSGALNYENKEIKRDDLTYYKVEDSKDNNDWFLKFDDWIDFYDYVYIPGRYDKDMVFDILDGKEDLEFYIEYRWEQLQDIMINDEVIDELIEILQKINKNVYLRHDVQEAIKELKDAKYPDFSDVDEVFNLYEKSLDEDSYVIDELRNQMTRAYEVTYEDAYSKYYRNYLQGLISDHFNFLGVPAYNEEDKKLHVKIKSIDIKDLFASMFDEDGEDSQIEYYPDDNPYIDIDIEDFWSNIIDYLQIHDYD